MPSTDAAESGPAAARPSVKASACEIRRIGRLLGLAGAQCARVGRVGQASDSLPRARAAASMPEKKPVARRPIHKPTLGKNMRVRSLVLGAALALFALPGAAQTGAAGKWNA